MDEYRLYELQCLKGKISSIIGRLLVSLIIGTFLNNGSIGGILIMYIMVSWYWIFVRMTRNWIIGIVLGFLAFLFCADRISNMDRLQGNIWAFILLFGVIIIDFINIIRYLVLKASIIKDGIAIHRLSRTEMRRIRAESNRH